MTYRVRKLSPRYIQSFIYLLDRCFGITNTDKNAVIRWKFFHRTYQHNTVSYIALNEIGEVISQYTNAPVTLSIFEKKVPAMRCLDMATDIRYRGKGLISMLSKHVYEEVEALNYYCSIGFSNDAGIKVDRYAKNYGYQIVGKMERYITYVLLARVTPYTLKPVEDFGDGVTQQQTYIMIHKSLSYLEWRYKQKPNNDYHYFKIYFKKKEQIGYVVLRFSEKRCFVIDIITEKYDTKSMQYIVRAIENISRKKKKKIVIFLVLDNEFWKSVFRRKMYIKKRYSHDNYYLTVKVHPKGKSVEKELLNKDNWIVMGGDIM